MKKIFAVLIIVVTVGVVVYAVLFRKAAAPSIAPGQAPAAQQTEQKPSPVQAIGKPPQGLPDGFPADIPLEKGATVTQNYNSSTTDGRTQATRTFETKKTLAENFTVYSKFFSSNGWKIVSTTNTDRNKSITAQKGKMSALVSMDENSVSHLKTVNINIF